MKYLVCVSSIRWTSFGADFEYSFGTLKSRLGANAIAIQIPIGAG